MTQEDIMQTWHEHLEEQRQERQERELEQQEFEQENAELKRAALRLMKREESQPVMSYEEIAVKAFNLYRLKLAVIHGGGRKGKIKTAARKKGIKIIARTQAAAAAGATAAALDSLTELTAFIHQEQERERLEQYPLAYKHHVEAVKTKILER